ncbi:hypothetical protein [Pseudonocardia alaniniphila]|uniref:ParB-like N-terminal domain-containing protein n=1 Tax=Pseudonocardia alaniniphila TaxID=75291 RepID=A0ABS9TM41_9PSEU|nr:hypothetical protein [Pseudonocardia alaniniphila]MCH6169605.1 hypothetical protein [Pseudonocardia alaniniphila]
MDDNGLSGDHARTRSADSVVVSLPTELVVRYRAADREFIGAPIEVVDTPAHLDALTASVREHGILVPLRLGFNTCFGFLDGNHRIAVALRLGLPEVPVELVKEPADLRKDHGRPMRPEDLTVLIAAFGEVPEIADRPTER